MAYPSTAELVAESSVSELTSLTSGEQDQLRRASIAAIEEFTGQRFELEADVTRNVDGTGTKSLYLPKRLESLAVLTVTGSGLTASDVTLSENHDKLTVRADAGIGNYYERVMREFDGNLPLRFAFGTGTVQITGDWGWPDCPQDVFDALRIDMEDQALSDANALSDTIRSARALGLRDISQGNLSAAIDYVPSVSAKVQRLLLPYIWLGPVGAVI